MKFLRNTSIKLALIGVLIAIGVHGWEILVQGIEGNLHVTADDPSYYRPAFNWWETGTWNDGTEGVSGYVQRPPLMGIIHLVGYLLLGLNHSWFVFGLALVFHGWGIASLFQINSKFSSEKWAKLTCVLFISLPCFWGFLSYNITEAFVVSFCLITARFCLIDSKNKLQKVLICILLLSLFRPVLIVPFVPILFYLIWKSRNTFRLSRFLKAQNITVNILVILLLTFVSFWEIRKFAYTGEILNPHPIYHSSNRTIFRPPHQSMTELFKIWETKPEIFHEMTGSDWTKASSKDLDTYCAERKVPISSKKLFVLLLKYQTKDYSSESAFCLELKQLTADTKSKNKLQYYFTTPLNGIKEQAMKSQLNLTIFQETYRGYIAVESLRYICLIVLLFGYFALLLVPFLHIRNELKWLTVGAWMYGILLFWVQRMNEDRYMLPLMAIGFVCIVILTFHISEHFRKRVN